MLAKFSYLARRIAAFYRGNFESNGLRGIADVTLGLLLLLFAPITSRIGTAPRHCPCCGWTGRRFMPFLAVQGFLFDHSCPTCRSAPRHRGQRIFYQKELGLEGLEGKLLYFAPERNVEYFRAIPALSVKTSNYPQHDADYCIDILQIPFEDESWDFVVCNHVIEHLSDDRRGLLEFYRILKPGGLAIVSVPIVLDRANTIEYGRPNPREHDHYYSYGMDFPQRIPKCFRSKSYWFSEFCTPEQWDLMGLQEDILFVLEKQPDIGDRSPPALDPKEEPTTL